MQNSQQRQHKALVSIIAAAILGACWLVDLPYYFVTPRCWLLFKSVAVASLLCCYKHAADKQAKAPMKVADAVCNVVCSN